MKNDLILHSSSKEDLLELFAEKAEMLIGQLIQKHLDTDNPKIGKLLTAKQACDFLKISIVTLRKWTAEGKVKGSRIGTRIRYRHSDLEKALKEINYNITHLSL